MKKRTKRTSNIQPSTLNIECGAASRSYLVAGIQHRLSATASATAEESSIQNRVRAVGQACPEQGRRSRRKQRRNRKKEPPKTLKGARLIELTFGKYAIVDAQDYDRLSKYKWFALERGRSLYAKTFLLNGKPLHMHRLVTSAPPHLVVDHINHNGLDNRKQNLRLCTHAQNQKNTRPRSGGTSKYKGVHWEKTKKKFRAKIMYNRKSIHLGYFDDEIAAAKAYDKKAKELFGEYAYLNFPDKANSK